MNADVDVVVIGAGIHGAGAAQCAAAAGYSVRVLEQGTVAGATSSRSSKLIHGGLRYLENAQLGLVRESLREREILLRIAPGLVRRIAFHIPVYRDTQRSRLTLRAGLTLYALLDNLQRRSWYRALARREWAGLDGLDTNGLRAVYRYHDAQTDDAALTRAVLRSAQDLGAELCCPAIFLNAQRIADDYVVRYRDPQGEQECRARALVNAAGPWVITVLRACTPAPVLPDIDLVQGAHIVLDGALQAGAYYSEAEDRRAVFILPWQGRTLVGTTETAFYGDPATVAPQPAEIDYLLRRFRRCFPQRPVVLHDQFAGLRVLPRTSGLAFHRSRETHFATDLAPPTRLVSIVGGKLTGYRATAAKAVAILRPALPARVARADTATLRLRDEP